jgi:hypothetical protein
VFYFTLANRPNGVQHDNGRARRNTREVSSAPIYGVFANQLGTGVAAGAFLQLRRNRVRGVRCIVFVS